MDVVDEIPVAGGRLRGHTFNVYGGVHGPGMNVVEGELFVDDTDLVAVALGDGGEDAGVEAGAEGALEVVEVDDGDGCGGRSAASGATGGGDERAGVGGDVVFDELCDGFAVVGDEEVDGVGGFAVAGEGDGDGAEAGDIGGLCRADADVGLGWELGLLAEEDLDTVLHGDRQRLPSDNLALRGGRSGLSMAAEGGEGCGEDERGQTAKCEHTSLSQRPMG